MTGGKILDNIKIELRNYQTGDTIFVDISIFDNSLSRKWLTALNDILKKTIVFWDFHNLNATDLLY